MNAGLNDDIMDLVTVIKSGNIPEDNLEEVIRRKVAYIAFAACIDSDYRKEVEEYLQSVEG
jgi:hypothetical protein